MNKAHPHKPHRPHNDVPEDLEPGSPPIEPEEGPVPALIPDDPEHDRVVVPAASLARMVRHLRPQDEVAR